MMATDDSVDGCDAGTCRCVIDVLVARGMLRWSREGRLIGTW